MQAHVYQCPCCASSLLYDGRSSEMKCFSCGNTFPLDTIRELVSVDVESWKEDIANIKEFYNLVGDRVPAELKEELAALEARLG